MPPYLSKCEGYTEDVAGRRKCRNAQNEVSSDRIKWATIYFDNQRYGDAKEILVLIEVERWTRTILF